MLVDIYRLIVIIVKFVIRDIWVGLYNFFFKKQSDMLKKTYNKRVSNKKRL
jgi:hypothetical protein